MTIWLTLYQRFWDESHERLDELLAAALQGKDDRDRAVRGEEDDHQ